MKTKLFLLTFITSFAFVGNVIALTKEEYKAQKDRITMDYKTSRDKCSSMSGNAKDICIAEAKGAEKVTKAELEAQYQPSPKHEEEVSMAKADSAYSVAREKCDDLSGDSKNVCIQEAKTTHAKAKEDAKMARTKADVSKK